MKKIGNIFAFLFLCFIMMSCGKGKPNDKNVEEKLNYNNTGEKPNYNNGNGTILFEKVTDTTKETLRKWN